LIAGSGSVATVQTGGGRGGRGAATYPDGVPQTEQYVINEYNTVSNRIKPPYTSIVKYDLNEPGIKWRIGFGDDPVLAARGITGTGAAATLNGIIVTQAGIVFGAGRDNQIRAWDSDTGKQLWSATFGGNFVGSPVMYEMDGRQYLLVPAAGTAGGGRGAVPTAPSSTAPLGWVAYALPTR
jgi:quinoprotein glucose dehydrogenase